jgi:hypothetical protein
MGLRCLLGHEYGNREVEREREERGDEVVVTYRTVETCERCGERRTVSENKEVRPVRDPEDDDPEMATGLGGGGVTPDPSGGEGDPEDVTVETADDEDAAPEPDPEPELDPEPAANSTDETTADDVEEPSDDGIILDPSDDEGDADRGHGEWPDPEDLRGGSTPGDGHEGAADSAADDEDAIEEDTTVVTGGDWPDPETDPGDDPDPAVVSPGGTDAPATNGHTEAVADATASDKQFVSAEGVERIDDDHETELEFFCPNCGHARAADGASMRAGDICPACHQGYISERERER